jgi:hypothetical protein
MIQFAGSISTLTSRLMAKVHGSKRHYQLLLDPHRAELLEDLAAAQGKRPAALARELVYSAIKRSTESATYHLAEAQDQALRRTSIQNQVRGRMGV